MPLLRKLEKALTWTANRAWPVMQRINRSATAPKPFHPQWSDAPIPRGDERSSPQLGWPRTTDSLCPACVKEARNAILRDWGVHQLQPDGNGFDSEATGSDGE